MAGYYFEVIIKSEEGLEKLKNVLANSEYVEDFSLNESGEIYNLFFKCKSINKQRVRNQIKAIGYYTTEKKKSFLGKFFG